MTTRLGSVTVTGTVQFRPEAWISNQYVPSQSAKAHVPEQVSGFSSPGPRMATDAASESTVTGKRGSPRAGASAGRGGGSTAGGGGGSVGGGNAGSRAGGDSVEGF
jgi:hypothetical protein